MLVGAAFLAMVPTSTAVGTCSDLKDSWCPHTFCLGYTRDSYGTRCERYVDAPDPCRLCQPAGPPPLPRPCDILQMTICDDIPWPY